MDNFVTRWELIMNSQIESQNVEFKSIWKDEYLRQISGFTNANGGKMFIGINDQGLVIGVEKMLWIF